GGLETNRTELLPGSPTAGFGPRERHERCGAARQDVKPPLDSPRKKKHDSSTRGEPPQAAYLMSLFSWLTQPELSRRVAALEKRIEVIDYEWADWYQKFRTLHARLAKQSKLAAARDDGGDPEGAVEPGAGGEHPDGRPEHGAVGVRAAHEAVLTQRRRLRGF